VRKVQFPASLRRPFGFEPLLPFHRLGWFASSGLIRMTSIGNGFPYPVSCKELGKCNLVRKKSKCSKVSVQITANMNLTYGAFKPARFSFGCANCPRPWFSMCRFGIQKTIHTWFALTVSIPGGPVSPVFISAFSFTDRRFVFQDCRKIVGYPVHSLL